jgi:exosome complex component MTR3
LEQYPKSLIDLYITVLEDDGSALAAAITCASLALANAEIEISDLVAGCALGLEEGRLIMDPASAEAATQRTTLTVAYMPALDEVSGIVQSGEMPLAMQAAAIQACVAGCGQVNEVQQVCLRQSAQGTA